MSLAVEVGSLAWCIAAGEEDGAEWIRGDLREVNRLLKKHKLPAHDEPELLPKMRNRARLRSFPYSWLHYLRRAVAFARQAPKEFTPAPDEFDPVTDERIDRELSVLMGSHIVCHSDCEGYYVPIDFDEPLGDDKLVGRLLGSSQAAMRELVQVAPLIGVRLRGGKLSDKTAKDIGTEEDGPLYIERQVWLLLFESFRLSIEHGTAVKFC